MDIWWNVKVFDEETKTTTTLSKCGDLLDIIKELNDEGLWVFVSAQPEIE
jgi:hypothetical protein